MPELGAGNDLAAGPQGHQSHWTIAGAADAVRVGLRREAHDQPDEEAFHGMPAAAKSSSTDVATAPKAQSGRTAAWSAHALRLELRQ